MVGMLAYATSPDEELKLDLDDELEEAFFATKAQVAQVLRYVRREGEPLYRHGHKLMYVGVADTVCPGAAPWPMPCWPSGSTALVEVAPICR